MTQEKYLDIENGEKKSQHKNIRIWKNQRNPKESSSSKTKTLPLEENKTVKKTRFHCYIPSTRTLAVLVSPLILHVYSPESSGVTSYMTRRCTAPSTHISWRPSKGTSSPFFNQVAVGRSSLVTAHSNVSVAFSGTV